MNNKIFIKRTDENVAPIISEVFKSLSPEESVTGERGAFFFRLLTLNT